MYTKKLISKKLISKKLKSKKLKSKKLKSKKTKTHKIKRKQIYAKLFDFDEKIFSQVFDRKHWNRVNRNQILKTKYVDMILVFGNDMYDKQLWNIKSYWKSIVSIPDMLNKYLLHKLLLKTNIIAPTILIDKSEKPPNLAKISKPYSDQIWIWRTDNKIGGGMDVAIITNQDELDKIFLEFLAKKNTASGGNNAILSKYITNPSLWINPNDKLSYKYHLRIYLLIVATKNNENMKRIKCRAGVFKYGEIVLAEKMYHSGDWNNTDIHDTHFTHGYANFPDDYQNQKYNSNHVFQEICQTLKYTVDITIRESLEFHPEAINNFQIFGCDFMLDNNGNVILIEINNMPSFQLKQSNLYKGTQITKNTRLVIHKIALTNIINYVVKYKEDKYKSSIKEQISNKSLDIVEIFNSYQDTR